MTAHATIFFCAITKVCVNGLYFTMQNIYLFLFIIHCFCETDFTCVSTVQLGYCDSDVTVYLLFWNMPIVQDRDVKFPYKRYRYYLQAF